MTTKRKSVLTGLAVLAAAVIGITPASAEVVYQNNTTYSGMNHTISAPGQFGDEIFLGGTDRLITDFQFELSGTSGSTGTGVLHFYTVTGTTVGATPFYSSDSFSFTLGANPFEAVTASGLNVPAPENFLWAVDFTSVTGSVGLSIYDGPTIGSSFDDFWSMDGGGNWETLVSGSGDPVNFGAIVTAVPEPSTFVYALMAGLGLISAIRYRRKA